ncbi:MAG: hypothetical protein IJO76_01340 [Clostridia bacterium]|nr:hypothetical protein [Clostridia bacterium]
MKRCLPVLTVVFAVLLIITGCSGAAPKVQPKTDGFSCQAAIHYRELELVAQLTRQGNGELETTFSLPKSLSGITLGWDGTDMTMTLGGVTMTLPTEKVPESALIRCLLDVLAAQHTGGTQTEEGYVINGEVQGKAYVLVCDPDTGLPKSLSVPEEELSAVFTAMEILPKTE